MATPRRRAVRCTVAFMLLCPAITGAQALPTVADARHHEGTIVRVDRDDLVLDVGALSGASVGDDYELYRPITVRHPVTGRPLRDRFPIGSVRVTSASQVLSIAHSDGTLARPPEVGDIVVPRGEPSGVRTPAAPAVPARAATSPEGGSARVGVQAPGASNEERAAIGAWLATLGRPPLERIALYRGYLREHPDSPFATQVRDELSALRRFEAPVASTAPMIAPAIPPPVTARSADDGERALRVGDPAIVALQYPPGGPTRPAIVQYRAHGETVYQRLVLPPEGDGYVRGALPDTIVRPPGFEYFVEAVDDRGRSVPILGASDAPRAVRVDAPVETPHADPGRTRIDLRGEYADIGSAPGRSEYFTLVEADFLQRVQWGPLYGYRVGFGGYHGEGQPLCAYDNTCRTPVSPTSTPATALYGYHEFELAFSTFAHAMVRLETGINLRGVAFGFGLRMRVGRERGTNIVFGGDVFDGVGQKASFAFNFFPLPALSMMAQGEVFNQEVDQGDPMFRFIGQVGYRVATAVTVGLRGSYQLRNIAHGGFGGGATVTFDW